MGKPKTKRALKDNEAKAVLRMLRGSGQKLNLVAAMIRGKKVEKALAELEFSQHIAADNSKLTNAIRDEGRDVVVTHEHQIRCVILDPRGELILAILHS